MSTGVDKYRRRVHFVKLTKQLREIKEERDRNAVAAGSMAGFFKDKVRALLDQAGVYADLRHQYMAYAEALDKTQTEMAYLVDLIREHNILRDRFERRGLNAAVLDLIDDLVIYRTANK